MLPPGPPPQHKFILFELDFNVKFPLLRLLQYLSDLKSTILCQQLCLKKNTKICLLIMYVHCTI